MHSFCEVMEAANRLFYVMLLFFYKKVRLTLLKEKWEGFKFGFKMVGALTIAVFGIYLMYCGGRKIIE
ncbi:hypothetical protein OUZ56_015933 [Daphnia magna]|uniref:Uncharacterized protein n=1 Tax=Daphnia magna TaxID=35525 RepID=A0ABR0AP65_9CRUS|nr:hypothetical protein OUZ56_015933 [Daphnia magna]